MIVVEWTINNFGYWNEYVHDKQIERPASVFSYCPRTILFPKGTNGCDEYLVARIYHLRDKSGESSVFSGQFCIYLSGSLVFQQEFDEKMRKDDCYEFDTRLKFSEVSAQIRKKDILHQDQERLILRFEIKWEFDRMYRLYTTIDVFDSCINMNFKMIKKLESKYILSIQYLQDDCENEFRYLLVTESNTILLIDPCFLKQNLFVSTSWSVLKFDSVTRTEENQHVFSESKEWPFLNSLTREEVEQEGFSLTLRIKIIPSNKYRHRYSYGFLSGTPEELVVSPTDIFLSRSNKSLVDVTSNKPENPVTVLSKELLCLYQDQEFSDFDLRCGEISIPTHKNILSARSPVFKALLSSDMREAESTSMDIPDLEVHTLGRFLIFLYSGVLDDLQWEEALKLYYAADKYQVCTLKKLCSELFLENVSVSNVCDILSLADKHQDDELAKTAHNFILKNYNDVLRSEGWKTFMIRDSLLAVKTVTYLAEKNSFRVAN